MYKSHLITSIELCVIENTIIILHTGIERIDASINKSTSDKLNSIELTVFEITLIKNAIRKNCKSKGINLLQFYMRKTTSYKS